MGRKGGKPKTKYVCKVCGRATYNKLVMKQHVKTAHRGSTKRSLADPSKGNSANMSKWLESVAPSHHKDDVNSDELKLKGGCWHSGGE